MRKITCHCEQVFSADLPETVNLDENPGILDQIADGSFLSCVCPVCGSTLHTDLQTDILWSSKNVRLRLIPELKRFSFASGKEKTAEGTQIVIGYPELADRVAVLRDGLDPLAVEALKYHLLEKAAEIPSERDPYIVYEKRLDSGALEFHIFGLKTDEVAVTSVPFSLYEKVKQQAEEHPGDELFSALQNGAYLSVQNVFPERTGGL